MRIFTYLVLLLVPSLAVAEVKKPYDETKLDYFQTDSINVRFRNHTWDIPADYFKDGVSMGQMVLDGFKKVDEIIDNNNPGAQSDVMHTLMGTIDLSDGDNDFVTVPLNEKTVEIPGAHIELGGIRNEITGGWLIPPVSFSIGATSLSVPSYAKFYEVNGADALTKAVLKEPGGLTFNQQMQALPSRNSDVVDQVSWQQVVGRPLIKDLRVTIEDGVATLEQAGEDWPVPAPEFWPGDTIPVTRWEKRPWSEFADWVTDPKKLENSRLRLHDLSIAGGDLNAESFGITSYDASTGKLHVDTDQNVVAGGTGLKLILTDDLKIEPRPDYTGKVFGLGLTEHGEGSDKRIIADLSAPKIGLPRGNVGTDEQWILEYQLDAGNVNWSAVTDGQPNPEVVATVEGYIEGKIMGYSVGSIDLDPLGLFEKMPVPVPATEFSGNIQFYMDPSKRWSPTQFMGIGDIDWRAFGFPTTEEFCETIYGIGTHDCEECKKILETDMVAEALNTLPDIDPTGIFSNAEILSEVEDITGIKLPSVTLADIFSLSNEIIDDKVKDLFANDVVGEMINAVNGELWNPAFADQSQKFWIMDGINSLFNPIANRAAVVPEPKTLFMFIFGLALLPRRRKGKPK